MPLYCREKELVTRPQHAARLSDWNSNIGKNTCHKTEQVVNPAAELKRHRSASMPPVLTFLFHFVIPLPISPHQRTRVEKNQYVSRLYHVRNNGFTCLHSGDRTTKKLIEHDIHDLYLTMGNSPEALNMDAVLSRTIILFHAMSVTTGPALIWEYIKKNPVDHVTKRARTRQK